MKTKNWIAIGIFVLLAAAAFYILTTEQAGKQSFDLDEAMLAVRDTGSIDSIFVARKDGYSATLSRFGQNQWLINKRTRADKNLVKVLLRSIHDIDVRRPVNKDERTSVIKDLATKHTKVEIYAKGILVKSYYLGAEADDNQGNYILTIGSETPFVAHIPGFDGILGPRFNIVERLWRDKQILMTSPAKLQSVSVNYLKEPNNSFQIQFNNGKFNIPGVSNPDTLAADKYLQYINSAYVERYLFELTPKELDSLQQVKPYMTISVKNLGDSLPETLTILPPRNESNTYAYLNKTKEWAIYQLPSLDKLKAVKSSFISQPVKK